MGDVECFGQRLCEPCAHLERLTAGGEAGHPARAHPQGRPARRRAQRRRDPARQRRRPWLTSRRIHASRQPSPNRRVIGSRAHAPPIEGERIERRSVDVGTAHLPPREGGGQRGRTESPRSRTLSLPARRSWMRSSANRRRALLASGRSYSDVARAPGHQPPGGPPPVPATPRRAWPGTWTARCPSAPRSGASSAPRDPRRARSARRSSGPSTCSWRSCAPATATPAGRSAPRASASTDVRREAAAGGGTPPSALPPHATCWHARCSFARRDHAERVEVEHVLRGVLETMDAGSGSLLRRLRVPAKRILGALEEAPAAKAAG